MSNVMRTTRDRIRHALSFEILLLIILTPITAFILNKPMETMGGLSIAMSILAMCWNYIYNIAFDHALVWLDRPLYPRGAKLRAVHAVLFEITLFCFGAPLIMYVLGFTFVQAMAYDAVFMVIIPIYAMIFNAAYDRLFPVGQVVSPCTDCCN